MVCARRKLFIVTHIISHICMRSLLDNHRDLATNDGKPFQTEGRNILTSKQLRQKGCNLPASGLELSESSVRASTSTAFNAPNKSWQQVGFGGGSADTGTVYRGELSSLCAWENNSAEQKIYIMSYRCCQPVRCLVNFPTTSYNPLKALCLTMRHCPANQVLS